MANKIVDHLERVNAELAAQVEATHKEWQNERSRRVSAEKERDDTRSQFADLKERLHNAELEIARLNGYLDRVQDQDVAAAGAIEVGETVTKQMVPKIPPRMRVAHASPDPDSRIRRLLGGEPERQPHWTSYGQR